MNPPTLSIRTLVLAWAALLVLLAITVGASFAPIGGFNPVVSFGVALAKATLIYWFYMHLREESGLVRIAAAAGAAWLLLLLILSGADFASRGWF
jgi:cytochrome c oxidase subunit 4